jgi:hypothetical protein
MLRAHRTSHHGTRWEGFCCTACRPGRALAGCWHCAARGQNPHLRSTLLAKQSFTWHCRLSSRTTARRIQGG